MDEAIKNSKDPKDKDLKELLPIVEKVMGIFWFFALVHSGLTIWFIVLAAQQVVLECSENLKLFMILYILLYSCCVVAIWKVPPCFICSLPSGITLFILGCIWAFSSDSDCPIVAPQLQLLSEVTVWCILGTMILQCCVCCFGFSRVVQQEADKRKNQEVKVEVDYKRLDAQHFSYTQRIN